MKINMKYNIRRKKMSMLMVVLLILMIPLQVVAVEIEPKTVKVSELDLGDYLDKMTVGEKQLLNVTILPIDASETKITYSSSDVNVATVNGLGRISAVNIGKSTITVTAGGISQSFQLNVVEKEDSTIEVSEIEIGEHESEVEVGKTITISGTVLPSDATDSKITYSSSNPLIATVNSTGEVKGIKKGKVNITLSAGKVKKEIKLTVKVATAGISINSDYLVLKKGEKHQLLASVTPKKANQSLSYKSNDKKIAVVSKKGLVKAVGEGTTTIIVSNGDKSVAVSVIVNEAVNYQDKKDSGNKATESKKTYDYCIYASKQKVIGREMLRHIYGEKQVLKIIGEGYTIEIDGQDIVNYNNKFFTDISLKKENDSFSFNLNKGEELCGEITLCLQDAKGKYLYLYNTSKEKYEWLDVDNLERMDLSSAGEYQLREKKLNQPLDFLQYILIGGTIILLVVGVIHILIKRKYWFW